MCKPLCAVAFLALAACGSSGHKLMISVNPPEAALFINGHPVGQGSRRVHTLEFGDNERIYVQATAENHRPYFEWLTVQMLEDNKELPIVLPRR